MDFIERIFGISPDGGSGATETLLFAIPILVLVLWRIRKRRSQISGTGIPGTPSDP
jgi:hypothetical protein